MSLKWDKNFQQRLIVTLLGVPLLVFAAYYGKSAFLGLVLLILGVSIYELNLMGRALNYSTTDLTSYLFPILIIFDTYLYNAENVPLILITYLAVAMTIGVFSKREHQLAAISYKLFTTLYISLFLSKAVHLRELDFSSGYSIGGKMIITIFFAVWFLDTFAYLAGKGFGKHKLFPRVSPKKTVEGGVFGFIACLAFIVIASYTFFTELDIIHALAIGVIIGILGQLGDLIESFLKRQTGIKDSSSFLPGHGGILDRFDSFIFVSPFVFYYVLYVVQTI